MGITLTRDTKHLTRRDIAARLHVHPQTVTKWEAEGMPAARGGSRGRPSLFVEVDVRRWLAEREARAGKDGCVDLIQARARKERAQAELAEQTFKARARKLLPADEVERVWAAEVMAIRTKLLLLPNAISERLYRIAVLEGVDGVVAALDAAVRDVLTELAAQPADSC